MSDVLVGLAVLACPVGMGVMMWMMGKGMRSGAVKPRPTQAPTAEQLREEHRRLGAQIERLEHDDAQSLGAVR